MVETVSAEKQQEILKHIRTHGCKAFICHPKQGLTQAHIRIMLERNLDGSRLVVRASNWDEVVTTDVMDMLLNKKQKQRD